MSDSIQVREGDRVRVRSGQYVITAVVVEKCGEAWMVRNPRSGRVFKVRRILEVVADDGNASETLPASVALPPVEPIVPQRPPRRLSLVSAASEVLRAERRPMNTAEMVRLAVERGLWTPNGGRTPAQTLYGRIFEEIRHARHPRFRKSSVRGSFEPT